ncbi:hypothetical protein E4U53_003808 [Claviceps sorghi]|nr:hypothetical protein E4U53_003808 [Claviceps sorghi]
MERSVSPHMSEHSSYSTHSIARPYPSPSAMQAPMHMPSSMTSQLGMPTFSDMTGALGAVHNMAMHHHMPQQHQHQAAPQPSKSFLCGTCSKCFARRSDLARHDCQKTFTRRTTLTRHQNHHSGTIEEAAAATAAALAASKAQKGGTRTRADGDHITSSQGSPMTTPSPSHRTVSMSPSMDMGAANSVNRHPAADFQYLPQTGSLPPHLRGVGSPNSTSSNGYSNTMRPTSHPNTYGPPPILEPNLEQHQSGPGSTGGSPHMATSIGWQSPAHMPSPSQNGAGYVYPEPDTYSQNAAINQMYYGGPSQIRRPQSTEPGLVHMA